MRFTPAERDLILAAVPAVATGITSYYRAVSRLEDQIPGHGYESIRKVLRVAVAKFNKEQRAIEAGIARRIVL